VSLDVHFSSAKHDWQTPQDLFDALHVEFDFTVDGAANAATTRLPRWWGPGSSEHENTLTAPESAWAGESVYINSPYGRAQAAFVEAAFRHHWVAKHIVFLLPARTDTRLFHTYFWNPRIHAKRVREIRFLKGRLIFQGAPAPAPFPSMVVVL